VVTPDKAEEFELPKDTKGVIITNLNPADGPAAKAGLKRNDVIVEIDDKKVTNTDDLRLLIGQTAPDTKITVKYLRNGKPETKQVVLGRVADDNAPSGELLPGVSVEPLTPEARKQFRIDERVEGLMVTEVGEDSEFQGNFPVGSVIEQINRSPVSDLGSAKKALRDGRNIALVYYRGAYRYIIFHVR
ncbi:MAG: PDZ domain-containing protein, partial [Opitutus sp.]